MLRRIFHRVLYDTAGNTLIIAGFVLPLLILLVGGGVDLARFYVVRTKAQIALDSGVLSGAASISKQPIEEIVVKFTQANFPDRYMDSTLDNATIASNLSVNVVRPDNGTFSVSAQLKGEMRAYFLAIIGIPEIRFTVVSEARRAVRPMDLVLVADHSGSMCRSVGASIVSPSCPKLQALKAAARSLIETMFEGQSSLEGVYVGIAPYATHAKYSNSGGNLALYGGGGMDPRAATNPQQTAILEFTGNREWILSNIDSMNINLPTAGEAWTRINVGLDAAWRMLRPDYNAIFSHPPSVPRPFDGETQKVVILMTDGRNITYCPGRGVKAINPDDDADVATRCRMMKKDGITIYSVVFDLNGVDGSIENTKNLMRDCASAPEYFFDADDGASMTQAFQDIADSLRSVSIVR